MWFIRRLRRPDIRGRQAIIASAAAIVLVPVTVLGLSGVRLALSSVAVVPSAFNVGQNATGTVRFDQLLRMSTSVRLDVSPSTVAMVPAAVNAGPGTSSANFSVSGTSAGCAVIGATLGTVRKTATIYVHSASPQITLTTDKPAAMLPVTFRGTVKITPPRGTTTTSTSLGTSVSLSSSNPSVASVPRTVLIPRNSSSATFDIRGTGYGCVVISATFGTGTSRRTLMIFPDG